VKDFADVKEPFVTSQMQSYIARGGGIDLTDILVGFKVALNTEMTM
jgi:hypothetical protein